MLLFNKAQGYMDVQVTGVETIEGRKHNYVRAFGTRVGDQKARVIEFHLTTQDAGSIIESAYRDRQFPIVEVPMNRYTLVASAGDVKCVYMENKE